jgi:hypothetical protein
MGTALSNLSLGKNDSLRSFVTLPVLAPTHAPCSLVLVGSGANVMILEPAVISWVPAPEDFTVKAGSEVTVRLEGVDVPRGYLLLAVVPGDAQAPQASSHFEERKLEEAKAEMDAVA